ncbi:MAG: S8 family peptidase, partial [Candidatus Aenigmarchaeota archaeon]|nr:S8 family peptidase [Candidatus Aenigmarchaeota archaeon]
MRRISRKKVGLAFLILIVTGMLAYFGFGYFGSFMGIDGDRGAGDGATGMNVFDNGEKTAEDKISREVKNKIEESGNEKITILVKHDDKKLAAKVEKLGGQIRGSALDYIAVEIDASQVEEIAENKNVLGVYPDRKYYAALDNSAGMINAGRFWDNDYTGAGVKIAILDTGIDESHPMLRGKVVASKIFTGDSNAGDFRGHGTHVAGIAAGKYNEGGYNGVAPDALLLNAKVLDDAEGSGTTLQIIQGIEWAVDPDVNPETDDGADVISMSLGGAYSTPDAAYIDAIKYAISRKVVVIVASGNCGNGCASSSCGGFRGVTVPGSVKEVITVGAVDDNKNVACFSSGQDIDGVGIKPDVVAPGKNIVSSVPYGYDSSGYGNMSGTSMATPHVAGAAALLLEKNPSYTHEQVKHLLEASADDLGIVGKDTSYGSGFVNLEKAFSFGDNSELEYDIEFNSMITKDEIQEIKAMIFDDVNVENVSLQLTYPDGEKKSFDLGLIIDKKEYGINISNLNEGHYNFEVGVVYDNGLNSVKTNEFDVIMQQAYSGRIVSMDYSKELAQDSVMEMNVSFENLNASPLRTYIEVQLLKEDNVIDSFTSGAVDVEYGKVDIDKIEEIDAEDSFSCEGEFNNDNCSMAVDEDWETAASGKDEVWDKSMGCSRNNYVYENFTIGGFTPEQPGLINFSLRTNLKNDFACSIEKELPPGILQLRTSVAGINKNGGCIQMCIAMMTEHYYSCPVEYWDGFSWAKASGGVNQIDGSGCMGYVTTYYDGKVVLQKKEQKPSAYNFNIEMPVNVSPGNYSLKVIAYYENGQDVKQDYLFVKDLDSPIILDVNYSDKIIENSPEVMQVTIDEDSEVHGNMLISNPDNEVINITLKQIKSLPNPVAIGSFLDALHGEYKFNFTICDEYGNCADSGNYNFLAEECGGSKALRKILYAYNDEPGLLDGFKNDYCIADYSMEFNPELGIDYLKRFDGVVLNSGNRMGKITENDANALIEYAGMNKSVLLEGADIGFQYGDNEFMRKVAHAVLLNDMSFVSSVNDGVKNNVNIINNKNFLLLKNLDNEIAFDAAKSMYPDALQEVNNGLSIASWSDGKGAIVASEYGARTLFIPFSLNALNSGDADKLLLESLEWMTNYSEDDIALTGVEHGYLISGENKFNLNVLSSKDVEVNLEAFVDDAKNVVVVELAPGENLIPVNIDVSKGVHNISFKLNNDY